MRPPPLRIPPLLMELKVRVSRDVSDALRAGDVGSDALVLRLALDLELAALEREDLGADAREVVGVVQGELRAVLFGCSGEEAEGEAVGEGDLEGVGAEGLEVKGAGRGLCGGLGAALVVGREEGNTSGVVGDVRVLLRGLGLGCLGLPSSGSRWKSTSVKLWGSDGGIQIAHHRVGRFQRKFHLEEVCSRYLIFRTSDLLVIEKLQQRRLITSRRMKSSLTSRV